VVDRRGFLAGLGVALAAALPPTLLVQLLDATGDGDLSAAVTVPIGVLVITAMGLGGTVAARRSRDRPLATAAVAALVAMALVQSLGVVRRSVAGHDVAWASVPVLTALGVAAAVGSALVLRRAGRTRP
jgi:hypothetical protein